MLVHPLFLLAGAVAASAANRYLPNGRMHANIPPTPMVPIIDTSDFGAPVTSRNGTELPPYNTTYEFDQLINHDDPSLGTFKQRFWHTYEFYEPGGPIILFTPGESNAQSYTGYLTNKTINGLIAQQENGSTIVLEHRYYGLSNPFNNLSDSSLRFHTIQQAIDDLEYFTKNVKLPMPDGDNLAPGKAPWVLIGGSYSGALTGWTMINKPNLFQAAYASSAVVESIIDFWEYFDPIRQFMPANCSADVQAVIAHVDQVFTNGTDVEIQTLKENWGLGDMSHLDDVAGALRNNLWDWQSLSPTSGPESLFFNFCDALEVKDGVSANSSGWGLDHALAAWGTYWNSTYYAVVCGTEDAETCLGTYDPTQSFWTDISVDNSDRSWMWIVCNQVGFFQDGTPEGTPTLVTRLVQPSYDERQCTYWFPSAFPNPPTPNISSTNTAFGGWSTSSPHLFFANGQRDPWRDATVSSDFHMRQSTDDQPIAIGDGFHCSDLSAAAGMVDETIAAVQKEALKDIGAWLSEWIPEGGGNVKRDESESTGNRLMKPVNAWLRKTAVIQ